MSERFDFGGYATKNNLKCADGRTIRKDAFIDCDGATVPLVWGHKHGSPSDVLGHAVLENRDDGVYTYGVFNNTKAGQDAKELVRNGDVKALSIYANQLVQRGGDVLHGMIREVSLCLAGANPGARIEELSLEHTSDLDSDDFEALVFNGNNIELQHSVPINDMPPMANYSMPSMPTPEYNMPPIANYGAPPIPMPGYGMPPVNYGVPVIHQEMPTDDVAIHADVDKGDINMPNEPTVSDVFESLTEDQKNVVYFLIGQALESAGANSNAPTTDEEDKNMAHNLFEGDTPENVITHDMLNTVIADGKKYGTLKDSYEHHMTEGVLAHAIDTTGMEVPTKTNAAYATSTGYGINSPDFLFPEARTFNDIPEFIKRDTDWVDVVLNGVHRSPFARVKSMFANITEDEARAKGYIKGNLKKNEFFSLMKRVTTPQTVYKKQKMDRDDIVDITDFDVVAWIKSEMRMMLNEELARAFLIGDGRDANDDDKININNVRPIVSDVDLFTIKKTVNAGSTEEETAKNMIKAALRARKDYKGSGNPTLFTTDDWLTSLMLIEDGIGRRLYNTEAELAAAMRVKNIVTVPVMEGYKNASNQELMGVIVNLSDYNVGADKGGSIEMFDDFNIDYNQYIYLIETRCSGALTKPYSAIALYKAAASNNNASSPET